MSYKNSLIMKEASEIKTFIEKNKAIPKTCNLGGIILSPYSVSYLMASMIKNNGTGWIAFLLLEGSDDLGILEISFIDEPEDKQAVGREIRKLGAIVASKLDFANSKKGSRWF